jgi:ATP-binding cassette subfamily B protein
MASTEFEEEEFTGQLTGAVFKRIIGLIRPHLARVITFTVAMVCVSMMDSIFTLINKQIIDRSVVGGDASALLQLAAVWIGLTLVQAAGAFTFIYMVGVLGERVRYDLRKKMFNHLQELSLSYYNQNAVGRLIARVTSDSERVSDLLTWGLLDSTWAFVNIITSAAFMLYINWRLALIVMAILPVLLLVAVKFRKLILVEYRASRKTNSKITGAFNENVTGVRVTKALGREAENLVEFKVLTKEMYRASYRAAWLSALFLPSVQMISALVLSAIVWYGGIQAKWGFITLGGIQAFISYVTFMLWPVQDLARIYADMQNSIASAERIFKLLDTEPDIKNRPEAFEPASIHGEIEFEHVDFFYDDDAGTVHQESTVQPADKVTAAQPGKNGINVIDQEGHTLVLKDFNLRVKPGETIALVGPTGGGKTTIVNLICRFFEPKRGIIRLNGRDYTEYTLHSIQSRIGVVLQTPHLFSGTVRENIRYGCLDATIEDIEEAAKLAGAHEFITRLEKGYDQEVGEGGNLLSVGQKQLISLARAVLAKPEIFIMDEATSSVDTLTEAHIQRGMEHLMKGRTSFVIAHRLSTIKRADRIIVIHGGQITEMGTHAELLSQRGHYYRLYTQQFRYEREQAYGNPLAAPASVN